MPGKLEALGTLFLLLPGFMAAYITQQLAVRRPQTEAEKLIEALIFSFVIYLLDLPFFRYGLPLSWVTTGDGNFQVKVQFGQLVSLLVTSIISGILYAASINHDWLLRTFRKLKVTERTARSGIWNDVFQEIGGFVQVAFKDGSQLLGWVRYYSDDVTDPSLFLEQAAWVDGEDEIPIAGPGILLLKESGVETITFLTWDKPSQKDTVLE